MRLLLVEDDAMIGEAVQRGLRTLAFTVDWIREGENALPALRQTEYDLLVLDLGLPGRNGLDILREVRGAAISLPVLILTARGEVSDKVAGLDAGADDYLVKPFDLAELAARARALLRRRSGRAQPLIEHLGVTLDPAAHRVIFESRDVALSAREYAILAALMERPGSILSRQQLEERLYGWNEEIESNAIEVHIHALRRKLSTNFIQTVRGLGYRIRTQV
ncbi:MAG TPA: response regulator transcription factor [Steroidobacteraceae bacterium]|nr:response regulator transcription factor [Steroidobacteraceae bacterium]